MQAPGVLSRLGSVRARTTAAALAVTAIVLVAASVALLTTLRAALVHSSDEAARTRVVDLAALAASGELPRPIPVEAEDDFAQVVDASGTVVAGSAGRESGPPLVRRPAAAEPGVETVTGVPDGADLEDYRVWSVRATTDEGPVSVHVATSLEGVTETITTLRTVLLLGSPLVLLLLGVGTWVLTGRALRPVERLRSEVDDIGEHALDRRVDVPPTDDEVARLASTMNSMLARLDASSRRQRQLVADASHELRSPVASLRAQLEVALAQEQADWPRVARDLLSDTQRLESLVQDLLYLAREDETASPAPAEPVDLDDVVLEEARRLRPSSRMPVDTSGVSAAPVTGSRDGLARVVRNLLANAVEHARSEVRVTARSDAAETVLVVEDDGPGVPEADRQRIFERFVRLDGARSRSAGAGTGLGLAIVRSVVDRHGGTVEVTTAGSNGSAEGTRFTVRLPHRG
jgi:signal transduction histidine kinase